MPSSRPEALAAQGLPIYAQADEIVAAVRKHRVVIVEGPAGCGKTTQLPRMLAQAGLVPRQMGITQPRRIAAMGVAARIAAEEGVALGEEVGYAIRFDDCTSPATRIKVMTDGILLQEARSDARLGSYDVVLVDEAHERSLNIDFTLGLLHRTLQRRHDLKVVISSATLHPGHFQRYFGAVAGEVGLVRVATRLHPLQIDYVPPPKGYGPQSLVDAVCHQVRRLLHETQGGHLLVFLPGEALIARIAAQLQLDPAANAAVLPLYGRMPQPEQQKVFAATLPQRKVILATNIAETSITIDHTVAVIDCGLHKLPWFDARTGVTTLREEPISLASAAQRAGRAGRTGPGRVVRLYDAASMDKRPEFTREEILRIDLSEAVLRLIDLGMRDVEHFAFPTPPPRAKLLAALHHLDALGAIDQARNLTLVGKRMVPYPLSPALARMVVEACSRFPEALGDVLLAAALLSVRSPFAAPAGAEEAAQAAHAKLRHPLGDVMTSVQIYHRWAQAPDRAAFCKRFFLEADTMQFVARAHGQLMDIATSLGNEVAPTRAAPEPLLRCVATGFADKLLRREGYFFTTLQGLRVSIHPSSALYGSKATFAVAAELMSSHRTYAFGVSALEPGWVAEASARAAQAWRLHAAARPAKGATDRIEASPRQLRLGKKFYPLKGRRRPKLELPLHDVAQIVQQGPHPVAAEAAKVQALVVGPFGVVLRGSLAEVLALLPQLPDPALHAATLAAAPPPATIVAWDRSLHLVERHLHSLLTLRSSAKVAHPGWIALLHNGQGGVWFEVLPDYLEALLLSRQSLEAMQNAPDLAADASLRAALAKMAVSLRQTQAQLEQAAVLRRAMQRLEA